MAIHREGTRRTQTNATTRQGADRATHNRHRTSADDMASQRGQRPRLGIYAGNARAVAAMAATMAGICQWTGQGDACEWAIRAALNITTAQYAIRVTTNTVRVTNRLLTKIHDAATQGWAMTQHTRGGIDRAIANARWIAMRTYMYTIAATVTIIQYNYDTEEEGASIDIVTQAIQHMTRRRPQRHEARMRCINPYTTRGETPQNRWRMQRVSNCTAQGTAPQGS